MPYINDDGVDLWYDTKGDGPPVVVSGGFGLLHNQWDKVRDELAADYRVIDWNYRGAGQSDRSWPGRTFNQDVWVDDLEKILAALNVEDAVLWGTSTGSPITIRYAARYPQRVRAVITYPMFKADPGFRQAFDGFTQICEMFGHEALAALTSWIGVARENLFTAKHGELARWEAECFARNFSVESLGETMAIVAGNDFTSDLGKLTMPVLVLMGESGYLGYETPGNRALAEEFLERVPHARLELIPRGGGTYCMIEEPQATATAVKAFMSGL